jgi:hypothetical protein
LKIVSWDERESVNARLCLDTYEISMNTNRLYDNYISIRTPKDDNGNARYLGVEIHTNEDGEVEAYLTLEDSLGISKNTYWNLVEHGETGIQLFHNETTPEGVSYYLAARKGGNIYLTRHASHKSEAKLLFRQCRALPLKLTGGKYIPYSPCF